MAIKDTKYNTHQQIEIEKATVMRAERLNEKMIGNEKH